MCPAPPVRRIRSTRAATMRKVVAVNEFDRTPATDGAAGPRLLRAYRASLLHR